MAEASDEEFDGCFVASSSDDDDDDPDDDESWSRLLEANRVTYKSRDNTVWSAVPMHPTGRLRKHNVLKMGRCGPKTRKSNPIEVFKTIISPNVVAIIVEETNRHAARSNCADAENWVPTTDVEIYAFFGIVLYAGLYNANKEPIKELWANNHLPLFKATMSKNRFASIISHIRFDDGLTRGERLKTSKSAAIDAIWNIVMANLEEAYNPHQNLTVDEQLFSYHGRTRFTQYIPSKPGKYGIKVWWLCDAKTHYPLKGEIYTGKLDGAARAQNVGEGVVLSLAKKYYYTGRTIYADNFFSSLNLANTLITKCLAYVGTVRSNKRFIPDELRLDRRNRREQNSSLFCTYDRKVVLVSYAAKRNRYVHMMSTVHYDEYCDESSSSAKPQAILDYNVNKAGVDTMDNMLKTYTSKRTDYTFVDDV